MEEKDSLLYLGYMLSPRGSNLPNIRHKNQKSIGTQNQIPKLIEPLGPYRYESAFIYLQSLLRSSILYGSETMNNLKEVQWRELERIEESVMLKIFKTLRSCSRHLLYLEAGIIPARFQVMRQMMNYLQYILVQPPNSLLQKVYQAQQKYPIRGDWASEINKVSETLEIKMSHQEILSMNRNQFKNLVKKKTEEAAFRYLCQKQQAGKKGKYIKYKKLQIADYLLAESKATQEEKFEIFALRTEMNDLPHNFGNSEICKKYGCLEEMSNKHIFICQDPKNVAYEKLLNGNSEEKIEALGIYHKNLTHFCEAILAKQ